MEIDVFRDYCLSKKGTEEGTPFGPNTLVFKVMGKIFAITGLDREPLQVNLKCDPERAVELRERYSSIIPGYHMNKQHWNTVLLQEDLSDNFIAELIDHSYDLIVNSLPRKLKNEWETL